MTSRGDEDGLEAQILSRGGELLARARAQAREHSLAEQWLATLLGRMGAERGLRIQALRFIDVLPSLGGNAELVGIFREYFQSDELPLPPVGGLALRAGGLLGDRVLAGMIRRAASILSARFLAGQDSAQVLKRKAQLEARGRAVSLDRVGEITLTEHEAERYLQAYLDLIAADTAHPGQPLQLSVKLSALYSRISAQGLGRASEAVLGRLLVLARAARAAGAQITVDMEDYDKRPLTMAVFERWVCHPELRDWCGAGLALQTYLRDAPGDLQTLLDLADRRGVSFRVRLVRGAYWDQECVRALQHGWPIPVWLSQGDTDRCYEACMARLLGAYPKIQTEIATHNPRSLACALARAERLGLPSTAIEFQMLFGMAEPLQAALLDLGHPVRVYLPFGEAIPGMAYLVRRLLENSSSQSLERLSALSGIPDAELLAPPSATQQDELPVTAAGFANEPVRRFVDPQERERFAAAIQSVRAQLGQDYSLIIDGQAADGVGWIDSRCPAEPGLSVGRVATAGSAQAERAIQAAQRALPEWRDRPVAERANLLREVARRLGAARDELAAWEIFEAGKGWSEADADVCEAIDFLRFYADEAQRLGEERGLAVPGESNRYRYQPRGLGLVIAPWNFPLAILTGMLSATLAAGNCALLKPSSDTPVVAARFVQLLAEAGLPPGVVTVLPGPGAEIGEYLVEHPAIHLLAFTGSRAVGCRLLERAARVGPDQHHIKKVIAEMGGKNAIIVDASADLDEAVAGILQSAFGFQGQKCSACSRVIVVGDVYARLVDRLAAAAGDLVMDLPWEPHCDLGPVINAAARRRIEEAVEQAGQWGTPVFRGAVPAGLGGHYVAPAIFKDVDPRSPLAQEEVFGPVLALLPSRDFDQALAMANDTAYALTGGVYSRSPAHLRQAEEQFRVGNLYLNRGITGALVGRQPFGGFKLSGVGSKAGGPDYLLQFMAPRCVTENTLRRGVAPW